MAPKLETISNTASSKTLCGLLSRDGAVIVEDLLNPEQLAGINSDLDRFIADAGAGIRNPIDQEMTDFYGYSTVRIDGLPAKSPTFVDVMLLPQLCETADHFLLSNCDDYLLNTGQLIEIGPGETVQQLHRDEDAWREIPSPKPELQIEAMFALSDFTLVNGATQAVPGSHLWPKDREAKPEEIARAEMKAGSALIYLGSTMHGGGANETADEKRRGMFLGYVVGWLRTEENTFLTVPLDKARSMPVRIQELLGYKAHRAIGVVDVGDPMALLA